MTEPASIGALLPAWTIAPFAGMLLAIALLPLAAPRFWSHDRNRAAVAAAFALPVLVYLPAAHGTAGAHVLLEKGAEYLSFLALLASLFVISGGIHLRGSLSGTPLLNTALLALGALLASWIGTTGASVVLIRPLLRANEPRERKAHIVVFFIFVVSNCGGLLTPLGDPPLFLGFLKGVPFEWTLRLWREWLLVNGSLLVVFNLLDQAIFATEERERPGSQLEAVQVHEPIAIEGAHNVAWLLGVVAVIYAAGRGLGHGGSPWAFGVQETAMLGLATLSYVATDDRIHARNHFSFAPILEVAILFAGIFATMAPALLLLNAHAASFGIREPWHFFWASGALSSFLDNAPTYLTFAATAAGLDGIPPEGRYLAHYLTQGLHAETTLAAISCGSVFMGANTYIGNGPNFMVKAMAEQRGVAMPGFFGYMAWSGAVLIPLFVLTTFIFFR